jgi:hypothetical protein
MSWRFTGKGSLQTDEGSTRGTLTEEIKGGREHCSRRTAAKIKGDILVVCLAPIERKRGFSVHSDGNDDTKCSDEGVREV